MSVFAIADLHLSLGSEKPMDVFKGWENYVEKIERYWRALISPSDTVVIAGDISWGMSLQESLTDFRFLHELPGQKLLLKGNHDYWFTTKKKMDAFFEENGLDTLHILHNNCYQVEGAFLCGTRGWLTEATSEEDIKVLNREAARLEFSIQSAKGEGERIVFLHYPPVYGESVSEPMFQMLKKYDIKRCYFGHIHGAGARYVKEGLWDSVELRLISCDHMGFIPLKIL